MEPAPFPKLVLEEGNLVEQAQEILLSGQEVVIGRDPEADVVIPSPLISRRHVRLYPVNGTYMVEDLRSTNHTFLNGQRLTGPAELHAGDTLEIGKGVRLAYVAPPTAEEVNDEHAQREVLARTALEALPTRAETMLADEVLRPEVTAPPFLVASLSGSEPRTVALAGDRLRLGRAPDNDLVVPSPIVSAHHAVVERDPQGGYIFRPESGATNPVYHNGVPVVGQAALHDGDLLRIGGQDPGVMVTISYHWPAEATERGLTRTIDFGGQDRLEIGRDPANDVVLDAPIVSRFHATLERVGQRFRIRDLKSANGTFVNDQRLDGEVWLKPGDAVRIGPYRFLLDEDHLARVDETDGLRVVALGLNKWVRKDLNLLKNISLVLQPREFVVVVGQSGGGKSTLVDAIAGYRPASQGQVLVNGIDIYRHFDAVRNEIGFVPQRDIIHLELTVYQALDYAARLRMPADTTPEERHRRVMEVMEDLDLVHRKDVPISGLSGGQQKRVSIGVELLTRPGLFFLDEPTSGLDPGTETALMQLMRRLADQGRTIVLITHATKNVMLADRVLFLARGGYVAWFGPPEEALRYFDAFRSQRDRRTRDMQFDEIYAVLDDPSKGRAEEWAERYRQSPAYAEYVVRPLAALGYTPGAASTSGAIAVEETTAPARQPVGHDGKAARTGQVSGLRQFAILSSRNVRILTRDRVSLLLMLASAPLIALLDVLLSLILGRNLFDYADGNMENALITLFQPGTLAVMVGALAMMREFVKETDIYKRERLVNLKVLPYVASKLWVAALLAAYQAAVYTGIHYLSFDMPGGLLELGMVYVTLLLATLGGMALGLFASAISPNANAAPLIVILFVIPQVVLGGALIPVPTTASAPTAARWSFEAMVGISGAGSDLAADACWALPEEERSALSLEEKQERGCTCMGYNALDPDSCSFPGLGSYYDAALDQPEPVGPTALGAPPAEPSLPLPPEAPADPSDTQAVGRYLQALDAYQQQVDEIRATYRTDLASYQAQAETFKADSESYQRALADWNIKRSSAVSRAEGLLGRFYDDFGWTLVDKDDNALFWPRILRAWGAQVLMMVTLSFAILFTVSRKA
jgi:ABC-type multidrug transport system ATPase subunit/pSer/pThr/pTyr-binding forkhead associated (FHA) protein